MSYSIGQLVCNKHTEMMGEILAHLDGPHYRVRYPIVGDEDRDFDIKHEDARNLRPLTWEEAERILYSRYLHGPKEWRVPQDRELVASTRRVSYSNHGPQYGATPSLMRH